MRTSARARGFTLVEMVVALMIFAILSALVIPTMTTWIRDNRVRTIADALQNGVRLAQEESLRRSRQVVFSLTNSTAPATSLTAAANGAYWSINTIPSLVGETGVFVESGVLSATSPGVTITGPASICFNSVGRLAANSSTGVTGATCSLPTATPPVVTYSIALTGADRPLKVQVALGGQVHMCDPAKSIASSPDGC